MAEGWDDFPAVTDKPAKDPWADFPVAGEGTPKTIAPVTSGEKPSSALDFFKSIPRGIASGLTSTASAMGQAAQTEMGETPNVPDANESRNILEREITGPLHHPETRAGRFGESIGEALGNPAAYIAPGGIGAKVGLAALAGAGSEAGGQLLEGTAAEPVGRFVGAGLAPSAAIGVGRVISRMRSPGINAVADLQRAVLRDEITPQDLIARAHDVEQIRPGVGAMADVGGENVRGLVERVAQTPGAGRTTVVPAMTVRQEQQMTRISRDLSGLTGTNRTAYQSVRDTMASREQAATPLYRTALEAGDREIWSPGLERLSSSPTVKSAMQGAVRTWRDNAIADGYGAMNPGAMVDRGGLLQFRNADIPAFPNLQFWDYTKRIIDDEISTAIRAGQNQKVRTLTRLVQPLRAELDNLVPSYRAARNSWEGPSRYLDAIEEGRNIKSKTISAEEMAANFRGLTDAEREGYTIGAVSALRADMGNNSSKLGDLTKSFRSPEMRDKIAALMPTPEAAEMWRRRLDFEIRSSEMTNRALGNSATARRLAERKDANNIVGDIALDALLPGAHATSILRRIAMAVPNRFRDTLRSRSDAVLAQMLTQPGGASQMQAFLNQAQARSSIAGQALPNLLPATEDRRRPAGFASGGRSEAKSTKAQAHYRLGGKGKTCAGCQMFRPPHGCTSVAGKVSKIGLCDYFERKAPTFAEGGEVVADETDPFEIAARRTREAARPPGGRYEGALTRTIDTAVERVLPGMVRTAQIPGDAMAGKYAVQPETPGIWTEEDQFRADHAARQRIYDAMALSAYGTGATGTALKNMVPDMLPGVIGKMHQRELMRGHRGARERNPEASGKSSFAEGGDVEEADALIPPPYLNDPTTKTARAIGDAAVDVAAQPFNDIKRGLSGQMTDEEAKNFAFEAAMGFIPMRAGQALSAGSKGAFSSVLKPLDKPMLTNSMNDNTLGIDSLAERIRARIQSMPSAQETFLRPLDQARLAKAQQLSDQKMKEASYVLGPNPTPEEFKRWALRSFEKSKGGDRGDKYSKGGRLPDYMANTMRTRGGR